MSSNSNLYGIGSSGTSLAAAGVIPVLRTTDPTSVDVQGTAGIFAIGQMWINTSTGSSFQLVDISSLNGSIQATWIVLGGGSSSLDSLSGNTGTAVPSGGNIEIAGINGVTTSASGSTVTIALSGGSGAIDSIATQTGTSPVLPDSAGLLTLSGAVVAAGTNPVRSDGSANTVTLEVQTSQAIAAADATKIGLCAFSSADFAVDSTGFVQSVGGGFTRTVGVDAHTAPGTDPVVPTVGGEITVTGGQVAAGTTVNAIQTNSLAANTYTIQVQRSQAVGSSTVGDNGICHFSSSDFTVDANGFVQSIGGGFTRTVGVQAHTAPGTDPVVPTAGGEITVDGGTVAAGTIPVQTNSLAANTYTIQVQTSQAVAAADATKIGLSNFNSSDFTVDATGFVSSIGGGFARLVGVDAATAPGTNPVVPNSSGQINVTGEQVASGGVPDGVLTNSLAANSYSIQVQRTASSGVSNAALNGIAHFNSTHFTVDSNGFVSGGGSGGGISVLNVQTFTTSGTYTPTAGMVYCWVQVVGGGGGGGGASIDGGDDAPSGSGGGGGLYASKVFDSATIGASQSVTIGAGGAGGAGKNDGVDGAATSFGALISAGGGTKGSYMRTNGPFQEGGDGGQALTGTPNYSSFGGGGGYGIYLSSATAAVSGAGGSTLLSPGGKARGIVADGASGGGYGGGGSGAVAGTGIPGTGGAGDNGVIIVTEYIA